MSYAELNDQVSQLVYRLKARGIGSGSIVGIYVDRTPQAISALLAVLGSGAAYTIVEPSEPVAESANRLHTAKPNIVLSSRHYRSALLARGLDVLDIHDEGAAAAEGPDQSNTGAGDLVETTSTDIAYVIYTSGSTGTPKGVMITHGNIRHYTESLLARLSISEPLSYAHVTTLAADLGNTCLFCPLWTGGTIHLIDDVTRRDPAGLLQYLQAESIDVLKTTPSHWRVLFRAVGRTVPSRPALRYLLLGGEAMPLPLAREILESGITRTLVNHYGPTEATVGVAAQVLSSVADLDAFEDAGSVPIGTPFGDTRLFIRTKDGLFEEKGATGELYITGPSVARGYRDAAATASAFTDVVDKEFPGVGPAYRTGDKVRADSHGVLEFLGRGDRQVKIRGYRVELGHVEASLRKLVGVTDAMAMHLSKDPPLLVAAVQLDEGSTHAEPAALRSTLRNLLPPYMIPDQIEIFSEFPRNDNGKADHQFLQRLIEERMSSRRERTRDVDDPILTEVCATWRRHLGHGDFSVYDQFTMVGGTSIGAIQVIADLQAKGYQVSAAAFLAKTTPAGLAAAIRAVIAAEQSATEDPQRSPIPADDTALSPAQKWFFRQGFAQPDQWNQALLLDIARTVQPTELAEAVSDVVALHPMLRTAFRDCETQPRRVAVQPSGIFTTSWLPERYEMAAQHIQNTATARQAEMRISEGTVFKAHLFQGNSHAHLLLICHHLSVDAVSWRIIVSDLSRCYSERLRGKRSSKIAPINGFGEWAAHLLEHSTALRDDLGYWNEISRFAALPEGPSVTNDNREGDAQTVWFRLSRNQTADVTTAGIPPHAALLAAFARAVCEADDTAEIVIDVESHGRAVFDKRLEISRVVGWFTSTFPVCLNVEGDPVVTGNSVMAILDAVPNLGTAYGLHEQPRRTDVCFNYLGSFAIPFEDDLQPELSRHQIGPVRGLDNDRVYGLKLTARIHDGQLVADLSFTPQRYKPELMLQVARATRKHLLVAAGLAVDDGQFLVEVGSSTGLLAQVPRALHCDPPVKGTRTYTTVLLTGATGFIGTHLLHLMLNRTSWQIHCLVREFPGKSAQQRLREAYTWYFPDHDFERHTGRITVHAADLAEPDFGLADEEYAMLATKVEAVYHLASDTRLYGSRASFDRLNTDPVKRMIRFATTGHIKDLHYMSTLAVCGTGPEGEPAVFSENSLDIGQRFLNEYERSKHDTERLILDFASDGGTAFIYRSGNVTGHSCSGRFQRNAGNNRLVQILCACVYLGLTPRVGDETLSLSPVDIVAEGVFEISRNPRLRGGTFHVDTPYQVSYKEIFAVLRELGCKIADDPAHDFSTMFARFLRGGDEQVALAHFWASRPERNVHYDHTRTLRLLGDLGVRFEPPDRGWLRAYITGLIKQGHIAPASDT